MLVDTPADRPISSSLRRHNNRDLRRNYSSLLLWNRLMNFDVLNYIDVSTIVNTSRKGGGQDYDYRKCKPSYECTILLYASI